MTEDSVEEVLLELARLQDEYLQLEQALPPHGLKMSHYQRLEELEDLIADKKATLERLSPLSQ